MTGMSLFSVVGHVKTRDCVMTVIVSNATPHSQPVRWQATKYMKSF